MEALALDSRSVVIRAVRARTPREDPRRRRPRAAGRPAKAAAGRGTHPRMSVHDPHSPHPQTLPLLTSSELAFFARHGCVVVRGVLDPQLCAHARDRMWAFAPPHGRLQRDDPQSWVGPFPDADAEVHPSNLRRGYTWKLREPGGEAGILRLLPVTCRGIAEQLLGVGGVFPTPRPFHNRSGEKAGDGRRNTRGIYAQLPRGVEEDPAERRRLRDQPGAHFDSGITDDAMTHGRFMVTGLIDDTPPACPGFTLWPGSVRDNQSAHAISLSEVWWLLWCVRARGLHRPHGCMRWLCSAGGSAWPRAPRKRRRAPPRW